MDQNVKMIKMPKIERFRMRQPAYSLICVPVNVLEISYKYNTFNAQIMILCQPVTNCNKLFGRKHCQKLTQLIHNVIAILVMLCIIG